MVVARETGTHPPGGKLPVSLGYFPLPAALPVHAGLFPLLLHEGLEFGGAHREVQTPRHVRHDIDGEPVGVVELEDESSGDGGGPRIPQSSDFALQKAQPVVQGFIEPLFLVEDHASNIILVFEQFRIGVVHGVHHGNGHVAEKRAVEAQEAPMAEGPADDTPQDVTPAFVARQDAVADEKRRGPAVIGDDLDGDVLFGVRSVVVARQLLDGAPHGGEEVRVVVGRDLLHHGGDALEAHARVDAGLRQRIEAAVVLAVELHEHEVPEFQVTIAVAARLAVRLSAAEGRPLVDEDLGARTAGTGVAHGPEVVLGREGQDAVLRQIARPVFPCFLVRAETHIRIAFVDGRVQLVFGESQHVREEQPGELHGVLLEIVAEGEVAEHFKEGVMPRRAAHVLQVVVLPARAHAFLARGGPGIRTLLLPEKRALELDHARIGEKQSRVVMGNERGTLDDRVRPLAKEFQKCLANFAGFHRENLLVTVADCSPSNSNG